jgi:hypothetical protein
MLRARIHAAIEAIDRAMSPPPRVLLPKPHRLRYYPPAIREARREYEKRRRLQKLADGLCTRNGCRNAPTAGRKYCEPCAVKNRAACSRSGKKKRGTL